MSGASHSQILRTIPVLIGACLFALPARAQYSGGTGEPNDPYQIATAADLIALGETPGDYGKHFLLTANIDLDPNLPGRKVFDRAVVASTPSWNGGTAFTGVFDGNGHTISRLTIKGKDYVGLFGRMGSWDWWHPVGGEVKNLGVADVNVTGSGFNVGGLVGENAGAVIRCYSSGAVRGEHYVGRLVGGNLGTVAQCYSTGSVSGGSSVGGLVGGNVGAIRNSYAAGSVGGDSYVGGLAGQNGAFGFLSPAQYGAISDCYSSSVVTGTPPVGGLLGSNIWGEVSRCFWDIETSGQTWSERATGKTTAEMQTADTFLIWATCANKGIWTIDEGRDYPRLGWEKKPGEPIVFASSLRNVLPGEGTEQSPYLIHTAEQLNFVGLFPCDWDKHFRLMADIDMGAFDGKDGRPAFNIIGDCYLQWEDGADCPDSRGTLFTGVFDGNGCTISYLMIGTRSGCAGLFGGLGEKGQVKDVGIVDVNVTSSGDPAGALVGLNYGTLTNCHSAGVITGCVCVGGLVGINEGTVTHCYSTCTVSGLNDIGGLVGRMYYATVTQCYSSGGVSGENCVGGLVGENYGYGAVVAQCYSTGTVSGKNSVGGLVGGNDDTAIYCYSTGAVSGESSVGGLIGTSGDYATARGCLWDISSSGQTTSAGGTGKTTTAMQTAKTFLDAGWDFVGESANGTHEFWLMPERGGSPVLAILSGYIPRQLQGHGTPESPYLIFDAWDLGAVIHQDLSGHYQLAASIDLSGIRWVTPVIPRFAGVFEGNSRTISNLTIDSGDYVGMFGQLQGVVRNLGVVDVSITGSGWCVGALAGENYGEIRRSYSTGAVSGMYDVGGLVGSNMGAVPDCYNTAAVSGVQDVGGLLGVNQGGGDVTRCYSAGTVHGGKNTGGLVGDNMRTVTDCYSTGPVSGTEYVGGLVGENGSGDVMRCYSTGAVSGTKQVGGLVGYTSSDGSVGASFWDIQTSGQTASSGGTGKTTAQMHDLRTYRDARWDFLGREDGLHEIWQMLDGGGYPVLAIFNAHTPPELRGKGIQQDPYLITDAMELGAMIHYSRSAHYRLTAPIDLSGIRWGRAVIPSFSGTFDGNGLTISHLTIVGGDGGLFGSLGLGAEVMDLDLADVTISDAGMYVGGLVGRNVGGSVTACHIAGVVRGHSSVGGLVGHNERGAIARCSSAGSVSGRTIRIGGLVGDNGGDVTQCCSTAVVSASDPIGESMSMGGLVGSNGGSITDSYCTGAVSGAKYVGGLASSGGRGVTNCYSTGAVSGTSGVGGLVGWGGEGTAGCFWDIQTCGQTTSSGGAGKTTAQMKTAQTFLDAGWDFAGETANGAEDIWWILEGKDYPRLWWELPEPGGKQSTKN